MLSLQLSVRVKLCSDIKVVREGFRFPVERLDYSINIIVRLERHGCLSQTYTATWVAQEGPIVQSTVLDCRRLFLAEVDRYSLQLFCSFVKFITSHSGCYVGVDSESVPEIFTYTSFPVMHDTCWVSELDFTPSVGFVIVELAFTRVTCRRISHPSLAFQFVIYYISIVVMSILVYASEDAVVLIRPRCNLSLIASDYSEHWSFI